MNGDILRRQSALKNKCSREWNDLYRSASLPLDRSLLFIMASKLCPMHVTNVQNTYKPYLCTFAALNSYMHMNRLQELETDFAKEGGAYCGNIGEVLTDKFKAIVQLNDLEKDDFGNHFLKDS